MSQYKLPIDEEKLFLAFEAHFSELYQKLLVAVRQNYLKETGKNATDSDAVFMAKQFVVYAANETYKHSDRYECFEYYEILNDSSTQRIILNFCNPPKKREPSMRRSIPQIIIGAYLSVQGIGTLLMGLLSMMGSSGVTSGEPPLGLIFIVVGFVFGIPGVLLFSNGIKKKMR